VKNGYGLSDTSNIMHLAIVFNNFQSGTQVSDVLDMSQCHKISTTKCCYTEPTDNLLDFPLGSDGLNMP